MTVDGQTERSANRAESAPDFNHDTANPQPALSNSDAPEEPRYYQNLLDQLLESIRNGDQATVNRLVSVIRSGDSRQETLEGLSRILGTTGQPNQDGNQAADGRNGRGAN